MRAGVLTRGQLLSLQRGTRVASRLPITPIRQLEVQLQIKFGQHTGVVHHGRAARFGHQIGVPAVIRALIFRFCDARRITNADEGILHLKGQRCGRRPSLCATLGALRVTDMARIPSSQPSSFHPTLHQRVQRCCRLRMRHSIQPQPSTTWRGPRPP